jgi:hypothetical protein
MPDFHAVVNEITELTKQEFGDFGRYLRGRLSGIESLARIVQDQEFSRGKNEKELHKLLEVNSWLIDPTFSQFLTSNQTKETLFRKLAQHLKIGTYAPTPTPDDRPDLVFTLHNKGLSRLVIVELKAPNVRLEIDHLFQLRDYLRDARRFLKQVQHDSISVEGILIGCMDRSSSHAKGVQRLQDELDEGRLSSYEKICDIMTLLSSTKRAHVELLSIHDASEQD